VRKNKFEVLSHQTRGGGELPGVYVIEVMFPDLLSTVHIFVAFHRNTHTHTHTQLWRHTFKLYLTLWLRRGQFFMSW